MDLTATERHRIRMRALLQPGFRAELESDPVAALTDELGRPWPAHRRVRVHEDTATLLHVVLPGSPPEGKGQTGIDARLAARARADAEFLARLRDDPRAVVEEETDIDLPDDLEIRVLPETENLTHIVLAYQASTRGRPVFEWSGALAWGDDKVPVFTDPADRPRDEPAPAPAPEPAPEPGVVECPSGANTMRLPEGPDDPWDTCECDFDVTSGRDTVKPE